MPCAEFEDRLVDYGELSAVERACVDRHLAFCGACREFFDALEEADAALAGAFSGVRTRAGFRARVAARIEPRPTWIPEILDFVGWAAMLAAAVGLARTFLPPLL